MDTNWDPKTGYHILATECMSGNIVEETLKYWVLKNIPEDKNNKELSWHPTNKTISLTITSKTLLRKQPQHHRTNPIQTRR